MVSVGTSSRLRQAYVAAKLCHVETLYDEGAPKRSDGGLLVRFGQPVGFQKRGRAGAPPYRVP
jgi:hypothetical protein